MKVDDIAFEVTVLLGKAQCSLHSAQRLQIGDIIILDQLVEEGLVLRFGHDERFLVTPGLFETHKAVVIDGPIHSR